MNTCFATFSAVLVLALSACASAPPAPISSDTSAIALGESLRKSLTTNPIYMPINSAFDKEVEGDGYSEYHNGNFCPERSHGDPEARMNAAFASLCTAHQGTMDGAYCRSSVDPEQVLFAGRAQVDSGPNRCYETFHVSQLMVVQPKGEVGNAGYMARLQKLGYHTYAEEQRKKAELARQAAERAREVAAQDAERERQEQRREDEARAWRKTASIGDQTCRPDGTGTIGGFIEQITADGKYQIRLSWHWRGGPNSPYRDNLTQSIIWEPMSLWGPCTRD